MNLQEFQKAAITKFKGLYSRGALDLVPPDHATLLENMRFDRTGEVYTREGINNSLNLSHPIKRMFLATPLGGPYSIITHDGTGKIYRYDTETGVDSIFYSRPGQITDFAAINMYGRVYLLPFGGDVSDTSDLMLQVWDGGSALPRPALGIPPTAASMVASDGSTGDVDPGVHKIAVSYVTKSGFETRPGPEVVTGDLRTFVPVVYTAPGGKKIYVNNIPIGGSEVVAREIFVTKAGQEEFFRVTNGYIADNFTTSIELNFFDTDLVVSADDLFDLRHQIEGAYANIGGIYKHHGRLLVWGRTWPTPAKPGWGPDKVFVSEPGEPEAFNDAHGWIQFPSEFDGNVVRGMVELRDVLYVTKGVGILSTQDNLDNPNTWPVVRVDGAVGCGYYGMSTVTASQSALSSSETVAMADWSGIYIFNGVVQHPPITWKINDIWEQGDKLGILEKIQMAHDPFDQLLYCLLPMKDGSTKLLVADYSEGLDFEGVKWSVYTASFSVQSLGLLNFQDLTDWDYHLRLGSNDNKIYKLDRSRTTDVTTSQIICSYQTALYGFGNISIFRALNIRMEGTISVALALSPLDTPTPSNWVATVGVNAAPMKEYTRQINFTSERMMVLFSGTSPFRLQRVEIYGKTQYQSRPLTYG